MQRLRRAIKKIAAVSAGVAMLGATMTSAVALDLADYPAPFIMDGTYNDDTAIVVGRNAAASDTIGVANVVKQLQFDSKVCTPGQTVGGGVTVSGDAVEVSDSSDLLELRESIGDVRETVTEVELDGLAGGLVTTNEGTTEFNQYLRFRNTVTGSNTLSYAPSVNFTENDAPTSEVGDFMVIREGSAANESFFEYELEFEDGLESDIVSGKLDDLEDEELIILGTTYTFVDTRIDTSANSVQLELLGGAEYAVLEEGEVRTFTIDGKEYEVEVLIIEDTTPATVTFKINGEITDQLVDGETDILKDGTLIGISDIILNEAGEAGSGDLVELFVGATKLEIQDTNYENSETTAGVGASLGYHQGVRIDEEPIEDARVQIQLNELSSNEAEIFSIKYRLSADALPGEKDLFVPAGHGVREYLDEPQGMLGFDWDIRYEGLDDVGVSIMKFEPAGDDEYNLELENKQGKVYKWPFITNEGGVFKYGDKDDDFVWNEGWVRTDSLANLTTNRFNIGRLDYFILSDMDRAMDDTSYSHIMRYNSIDTASTQLQFDDLATGSKDFVYETANVRGILGMTDIIVGGNTYRAYIGNLTAPGNNPLMIDMDGDGNTTETYDFNGNSGGAGADASIGIRFTVNGGGILTFGVNPRLSDGANISQATGGESASTVGAGNTIAGGTGAIIVNLTTLSENFDENSPPSTGQTTTADERLDLRIQQRASNRIGISTASSNWTSNGGFVLVQSDEDDDHYYGMTDYGALVTIFDPEGTDDAETVTIEYPLVQRGARVFITMGETSATKTTAGEVCTVAPIDINTMFDDEVTDPTMYNMILVGGPCINSAVEKVSGLTTCDEFRSQYGPGDAVVQLVENGDNVAMLVAGYNAEDTLAAAKAVEKNTGLSGTLAKM
jgi:hypothetical protein